MNLDEEMILNEITAYGDCEKCVFGMVGECELQCRI